MDVGLLIMDENPDTALNIARQAEKLSVHSIWTIDYYNRGSLVRASAYAAVTDSVLVGTSITPAFSQSAVPLAASIADIQRISRGRFILGLGSSTRRMNRDWYGVDIDHPAPRFAERLRLVRALTEHSGGPFEFHGRFNDITMAHLDHEVPLEYSVPIYTAGVGPAMTAVCGAVADGFVGHPIATVEYLQRVARPTALESASKNGRQAGALRFATQVIAVVDDDRDRALRAAAIQVAFYSTVKGYDPLFLDDRHAKERQDARRAFASGNLNELADAGMPMVADRAVYGSADEVLDQLRRYDGVVDLVMLYPPHFGIDSSEITRNERALLELTARR